MGDFGFSEGKMQHKGFALAAAARAGHLSHLERPNYDFAQHLAETTGGFQRKLAAV
jgi:hypothetical protein